MMTPDQHALARRLVDLPGFEPAEWWHTRWQYGRGDITPSMYWAGAGMRERPADPLDAPDITHPSTWGPLLAWAGRLGRVHVALIHGSLWVASGLPRSGMGSGLQRQCYPTPGEALAAAILEATHE